MTRRHRTRLLALLLAAAVPAAGLAQTTTAKKTKKTKTGTTTASTSSTSSSQGSAQGSSQGTQQESPQQVLKKIDARLLAWDTARARELHATLPDRNNAAARMAIGRVLLQENKPEEAVEELRRAAEAAPSDPTAPLYLAEAYTQAKLRDEAQAAYQDAARRAEAKLAAEPESVKSLVALGVARQRLRQLPEALSALQKARELAPGDAQVVYELGVTRAMAQEWQPAVDLLTEALDRNPENAYGYFFRAIAAEKVNRKDLLINDLERFLALAPNAPDAPRARRILEAI